MEEKRDSRYELLRIVSMFMIVLYHVLVHGFVDDNTTGMINVLVEVMKAFIIVHVNSFILVSGYYQCRSTFKLKKVLSLNNAAWFYRAIILFAFMYFNLLYPSKLEIIDNLYPVDLSIYWFLDMYLIIYCLSPFFNILINKMDKGTHQKFVFAMLLLFSILPTITGQRSFYNSFGFSVTSFMLLYFIGAYFRNYPIKFFDFYQVHSDKIKRILFGSLYFLAVTFNIVLYYFGIYIDDLSHIANRVGDTLKAMTFAYDNPLVIGAAVFYFLWFGSVNIKSKFINKLSVLTFGIYLIHDNMYIRGSLYKLFGLDVGIPIYSYWIIPKVIMMSILIFVVCAIIEWFRQVIFKFIYKRKISGKIRQKFYDYLEELKTKQPVKRETVEN